MADPQKVIELFIEHNLHHIPTKSVAQYDQRALNINFSSELTRMNVMALRLPPQHYDY